MRKRIGVLVVDDSPVDRELLMAILGHEPDLEVLGQAADACEARDKIRALNPDVIALDVSMPGMSGIPFLQNVMRLRPMPVVMCSALTDEGASVTREALAIGAMDSCASPATALPRSRSTRQYWLKRYGRPPMPAFAPTRESSQPALARLRGWCDRA